MGRPAMQCVMCHTCGGAGPHRADYDRAVEAAHRAGWERINAETGLRRCPACAAREHARLGED
jgi:predicted GNAT superfamily acetyltransferase